MNRMIAVLVGVVAFGFGAASTAVAATPVIEASARFGSVNSTQAVWSHDSWWHTYEGCSKWGKNMVDRGAVKAWTCEHKPGSTPYPDLPWELRVLD
jgi:hypothetical protein